MANEIKEITQENVSSLDNIWSNAEAFQLAQRMAMSLSSSTIVPTDYRGEKGIGNCMIALEMASRLKTSPMMVMQNLYVVNGRPSWSSQYIIAMINNSKKYKTEIQYEVEGEGDSLSCTAFVEDYSGRIVKGPKISMDMANKEGWVSKNMSKWKTMPEIMIRYRAASFFGRLNCPEMVMGIYSTDEAREMKDAEFVVVDDSENTSWTESEKETYIEQKKAELLEQQHEAQQNKITKEVEKVAVNHDSETGEIIEKQPELEF
ncbi:MULTISPECIES: hypothetical protein [unclassified Enterococcus]|uniref:hypothetical protein n=1 Tax=unclassified Enterococcus TaxID=2608891 RepID=UPI00155467A9|nr:MULTISPECIES: hypothetical protein [unclassified Enterococcus]MBS7578380.1 hypothetical protein [Enterococcus sp. MMGLQ5-2]MBS7585611.1 hypothetical protein [Enterococcus sp. MMGLQ5-1]NPD13470.1 hypothetical protein [Enterococcus sp. MMGLQ5-1]NPD38212.1 hypothetical protein [Enterococcus sp. MMGLQ5-2]